MARMRDARGQKVFEGTWDELMARKAEFDGMRLKLIAFPEGDQDHLDAAIQELFAEADRLAPEPPPESVGEATFGEIVAEKYRKQGLNL